MAQVLYRLGDQQYEITERNKAPAPTREKQVASTKTPAVVHGDLVSCNDGCLCLYSETVAKMEKESSLPQTVIAVVGDTGSGKSSLLNALLQHGNILPTSGMRACTAVVVRVSGNESSDDYEADVEFLAEKEWTDELEMLLKELTGRGGKVRTQQPDPDTEAAVAWNKIRAVYGPFSADVTVERLRHQRSVTRMLGKTKHIALRSVIHMALYSLLINFIR